MNLEKLFQLLSVVLFGVAAFFFWRGQNDAMFVAGVFGASSFFLSVRMQVKQRLDERSARGDDENHPAE